MVQENILSHSYRFHDIVLNANDSQLKKLYFFIKTTWIGMKC